jgi:hypothetical protein
MRSALPTNELSLLETYRLDNGRLMNVAPLSFASAFATIVFPHPGCPYSNTPFGAPSRPLWFLNNSGNVNG